jgi:hypothetical protein
MDTRISILLPTRDRAELVTRSLESLISRAAHPERLEIMIGIDDDDPASQEYFNSPEWSEFIEQWPVTHRVSTTERYGYTGLFKYVNYLGADSTGEFLMFWNDDALMHTEGWDIRIDKNRDYFGVLRMPCVNHKHPFALFPIIPRRWIDLFGTISIVAHSDWWIYNVCKPVNRVKDIDVEVYHDRADLTGNNKDGTFNEQSYALDGKNPNHPHDWSNPERVRDLRHWQQKLMLHGYPHTP